MKRKHLKFRIVNTLFYFLFSGIMIGQSHLPIIKATSDIIDIRDGKNFNKGNWTLAPDLKPDIYTSSQQEKKISFYTDLDSISCILDKNKVFDFIILLNDKDSCYTQVKYEASYLDVLKKAKVYNYKEKLEISPPEFTYQDSSNNHLKALREGFNLDSIAGSANELNQQLNLLHWIHNLIPHDGNKGNPEVKNAISLINECRQGKRGLNCRGLATVLNDCYLSMGWKSRHITCMPKDSIFNDCHVINMVFSSDLDKWIWVDPTHDSYIMDDHGMLLNFDEVRERLINDQPLILNPNANWNNKYTTNKAYYIDQYMAKNLYRFECPIHSQYNYETREKGQHVEYIELLPIDGYNQLPKITEELVEKSGVTYKNYKTNNPSIFWKKP